MNAQWKSFLESQGAHFDSETGLVKDYGTASIDPLLQTVIADLSHLGVIRVEGADAMSFLQGQTTNDMSKLDNEHAHLNGYCSPKGRLLASFYIVARDNCYYILLERALLPATLKRLRMFIMMSKVSMEDISDAMVLTGLSGPESAAVLKPVTANLSSSDYGVTQTEAYTILCLPRSQRYIILSDVTKALELWQTLATKTIKVGHQTWKLTDIRAAIPTIYEETIEAFVPQMVNMQAIQGVSFKKGCYTGQEVVARMQYLGKLKRRMYRAHVQTEQAVVPGMPIYAEGSSSGQGAGKVVDAQPSPQGGYELLAVIEIASAEQGGLCLESENGPLLSLNELPYSLEQAS